MTTQRLTPAVGQQAGAIVKASNTHQHSSFQGVTRPQWLPTAAQRWARHGATEGPLAGLTVGPLKGKIPLKDAVPNGHNSFTNDLEQVATWWQVYPSANIGARPPAGVVVIDIDVKSGGPAYWKQLCGGRIVPETLTVLTGSGGWHLWFTLPYQREVRRNLGANDSGIDLKTNKGYLVMPPSVHPITGGMYLVHQWAELAPLPQWLLPEVFKPLPRRVTPACRVKWKENRSNGDGLVNAVASAVEGTRNDLLHWAACQNVKNGGGLEEELIQAATRAGLPEQEARRTVASAKNTVAKEVA